jgi:hypothetical protein
VLSRNLAAFRGKGNATVTVTKLDGRSRTIFFTRGRATGYDVNRADPGAFRNSRQGDLTIVRIDDERYERTFPR